MTTTTNTDTPTNGTKPKTTRAKAKSSVTRPAAAMSDEHKAALAQGRTEGRAVNAYLTAIEQHRPRRGRPRTAESVAAQIADVEQRLPDAVGVEKLVLIQRKTDLLAEHERLTAATDLTGLTEEFVKVAKSYSDRRGFTYATWREAGVPAEVLRAAGITRGK